MVSIIVIVIVIVIVIKMAKMKKTISVEHFKLTIHVNTLIYDYIILIMRELCSGGIDEVRKKKLKLMFIQELLDMNKKISNDKIKFIIEKAKLELRKAIKNAREDPLF